MLFRPYPVLTLATAGLLGVLMWLGFWQLSRADWKRGLIAEYEARLAAPAVPLETALCQARDPTKPELTAASDVAPRVVSGSAVIRMFGRGPEGEPGWRRLVAVAPPACVDSDKPILAELSFEALQTTDYPRGGTIAIDKLIVAPWPSKAAFSTLNDAQGNDWHWFDGPAIATALAIPNLDVSRYLASAKTPPAHLRTPPAQHYGYATTWFGMALALLGVYGAFHARAGRLRFRKSGATPP